MNRLWKSKKLLLTGIILVLILTLSISAMVATSFSADRKLKRQMKTAEKYVADLKYEDAILAYEEAIALDPRNMDAYLGLAEVYVAMDNKEMAVITLERGVLVAMEVNELENIVLYNTDRVFLREIQLLFDLGRDEEAIEKIRQGWDLTHSELLREYAERYILNVETSPEEETVPVLSAEEDEAMQSPDLNFDEGKGLSWPVTGDVIIPFSGDALIYFETLDEYKSNPGMIISGEEGMNVLSAYDGVITTIDENEETGLTVTMSIGKGYEVVYGNLKDITGAVGDFVKEGSALGNLSAPTKNYVKEGTYLFFQVIQNGEVVDPRSVLR